MLNLWYGDDYEKKYINVVDFDFGQIYETDWFESDFSKRLIRECSDGAELVAPGIFKNRDGGFICGMDLTSGVKALLILMYSDYPCIDVYFSEDCNKYIKEVLSAKDDITIIVHRKYVPDDEIFIKYGVKLLNTGEEFRSKESFVSSVISNELL